VPVRTYYEAPSNDMCAHTYDECAHTYDKCAHTYDKCAHTYDITTFQVVLKREPALRGALARCAAEMGIHGVDKLFDRCACGPSYDADVH
jgi:hypothetical protein